MEFLYRIFYKPSYAAVILVITFFINLLLLATPLYVIQVLNRYIGYGVASTLLTLTIGVLVAILFEVIFRILRLWVGNRMVQPIDTANAIQSFKNLSLSKFEYIERIPVGMRERLMQDADDIRRAYTSTNLSVMLDLPYVILYLIIMVFLSFWLFVIALIGVIILLILSLIGFFVGRALLQPLLETGSVRAGLKNTLINETLLIRVFNAAPFLQNLWNKCIIAFFSIQIKLESRSQVIQFFTQMVTAIVTVFVISIGAILVTNGDITVGAMIGANILASRALVPIARFNSIISALVDASAAKKRLKKIETLPIELLKGNALKNYTGRLAFKDLTYAFASDPSPMLETFNLEIEPGELVAVTGPYGSGKSTLLRIATGLLEPQRGQLLVDHVDLRQLVAMWWRKQICYVPQLVTFFDGSIKENILINNPETSIARLGEIIRMCDLRSYIDKAPKGIEESITLAGRNLSYSVERRIAMARALSSEGHFAILDQPIEGLDPEGQVAIRRIIHELHAQRKTILISTYDKEILEKATCVIDLSTKPNPTVKRAR